MSIRQVREQASPGEVYLPAIPPGVYTCRSFATPWGKGRVIVTAGKLARVELPVPKEARVSAEARPVGDGVSLVTAGVDPALDQWVEELEAYFRGRRLAWGPDEVPLEALPLSAFRRAIYTALLSVAPGTSISYGRLARVAGFGSAARAVGRAMASNPLPIVIPCHRVVRSDGGLGGYGPGILWKERLLAHEKTFTTRSQLGKEAE